jgi:hypothetical protein
VLDTTQLAAIRLQEAELTDWRLVAPEEADSYLAGDLARRIKAALGALAAGRGPVELENGYAAAPLGLSPGDSAA